jgi:hypothetical protein
MARRTPPRKVRYFEPVAPRLARNTVIESTFEVGRRYRCTMRVDCGRLDPGVVIRPELGEWHPRMPDRLDEEELADWRAGRDAIYQLAALTVEFRNYETERCGTFRAGWRERLEPCCGGGPKRGCRCTSSRSPR